MLYLHCFLLIFQGMPSGGAKEIEKGLK